MQPPTHGHGLPVLRIELQNLEPLSRPVRATRTPGQPHHPATTRPPLPLTPTTRASGEPGYVRMS